MNALEGRAEAGLQDRAAVGDGYHGRHQGDESYEAAALCTHSDMMNSVLSSNVRWKVFTFLTPLYYQLKFSRKAVDKCFCYKRWIYTE